MNTKDIGSKKVANYLKNIIEKSRKENGTGILNSLPLWLYGEPYRGGRMGFTDFICMVVALAAIYYVIKVLRNQNICAKL